jgi:hypothetical protein
MKDAWGVVVMAYSDFLCRDQKLSYVKDEIAKIADGRKSQMKKLQQEYQSFKVYIHRR